MLLTLSLICGLATTAFVDAQITLGTAGQYGVFAATTITSTGSTEITGKIGLSPGTSITGFPPGINTGMDISNEAATAAKQDIQSAYSSLVALPVDTDLTGQDLGGMTLTPGVYGFSSSGGLTGTLVLDGQGDQNALFVFKFGSTITTATSSSVVLTNGAQSCNVYWQVGSSATLGTNTAFVGNVIAQTSITATTDVTVSDGGLYALSAAVTLDTNTINPAGSCGGVASRATIPTTVLTTIPSTSDSTPIASPTGASESSNDWDSWSSAPSSTIKARAFRDYGRMFQ